MSLMFIPFVLVAAAVAVFAAHQGAFGDAIAARVQANLAAFLDGFRGR